MSVNPIKSNWDEHTLYQQYVKDISKYQLLTRGEEKELVRLASSGDKAATDRLVLANLRFVINIAFMYKNQGLSIGELINEGNLGLYEAARRFDCDQKIKFISYAVWWIRQSITRAISEKSRLVRISAVKELVLRRLNRKTSNLRQVIGGQLVADENVLAVDSGYGADQIHDILKMGQRHASFDAPVGEDGDNSLLDLTADETPIDNDTEVKSQIKFLHNAVDHLAPIEKKVLQLYFGIGLPYTLNLQEIGKQIGLSKERVRQVKEKALNNLREQGILKELAA